MPSSTFGAVTRFSTGDATLRPAARKVAMMLVERILYIIE